MSKTLERKDQLSQRLSCPPPFHPMPVPCSSHNGQGCAISMAETSRKRRAPPSSPHRPLLPLCPSLYENQACKHARISPGGTHWAILLTLFPLETPPGRASPSRKSYQRSWRPMLFLLAPFVALLALPQWTLLPKLAVFSLGLGIVMPSNIRSIKVTPRAEICPSVFCRPPHSPPSSPTFLWAQPPGRWVDNSD